MAFFTLTSSSAANHQYSPLPSSSPDLPLKYLLKLLIKSGVAFGVLMGFMLALYASTWSLLQPYPARFELVSGSMSGLNINGPELRATWAVEFKAHNPNYPGQVFDYNSLVAFVSYHNSEYPLAVTHIRPFSQPGNNSTYVQAQVVTPAQYLNDDVQAMMAEDVTRGTMEFDVDVVTDYGYPCPYVVYARVSGVSCNRVRFELERGDELSGLNGSLLVAWPRKCREEVDGRPAAVKQMWFIVFSLSFVYLLIDVIM